MEVHLSHITQSYGKHEVLHNINLSISKGEIVSFVGPNGAGKSTCIKIITGGISPDTGSVHICGYDMDRNPILAKRCMGYLPENNPLYPELYVREYLEYVAGIYRVKQARARIRELISRLHLDEVKGKMIGSLSKGTRQRVGLAQAIIHNPVVLILDEPFSGLDPNQLEEVYELLKELGQEKAILFSSHSLQEVSSLSTRMIVIHKGNIVANDAIENLTKEKSLEQRFKELTQ